VRGDRRPAPEERYGSRDAYVVQVESVATALVAKRQLLPADAAGYVAATRTCDRF